MLRAAHLISDMAFLAYLMNNNFHSHTLHGPYVFFQFSF